MEEESYSWETDGDLPWLERPTFPWESNQESEWGTETEEDEPWRGSLHLNDWPEEFAGPEYWLLKNQDEEE